MTQNVPKTSLSVHTLKRLPQIQQGLMEGLSREQIGETCKVTEKTIDRDMNAWVQSGFFEIWLKTEFVQLYYHEKTANTTEAFKEISRIVGRMVTQKHEVAGDITETKTFNYNLNYSDEEKNVILAARRAILSKRSIQNQSPSLH